jgi:serine/threonine protein kinase
MDTMPGNDPMEKQAPLAGLDPAELLRQGAAADTFVDGAPSAFNPPPLEELAAIFPQFEILELIGQGGMGAVYKVRQKDLDRIVALKILPPAIGQSAESSNRFSREARALAKLNHPGIVTLHEFGQQDGLYFILMEFVDGVNLAQLMKTGRIAPREALAIVPQICDALQYAHDQGIVHRDIKPENILLDRHGRVKVADFGIAKVVAAVCDRRTDEDDEVRRSQTDATLAGKIIGTPQYMAPEQIEHPSDVDHRADIYALGVVFYQMLTGELPGKDLQAPSRKLQIDVRLDEIVLKALEKNPEHRYQQASVMGTRVETIVSEMGSVAVPAASFGAPPNEKRETGVPFDSRFSRTAIVGACWAPLILFAYIMWFSVSVSVPLSPGEEPPGPSWWQYLMMFTLLPLGLTSPFGTTILGWVSVSQIRRSAGKLHGMWMAVLDGLLFPLLVLTGLIGWFWHWVFSDLIRTAIIAGDPDLSTLERLIVDNTNAFIILGTLVISLAAGILIIRVVWRAVNAGGSSAPNQPQPGRSSSSRAIAIGCVVLALGGIAVVGLGVLVLSIRYNAAQTHQRFLAVQEREVEREIAIAAARSKKTEAQLKSALSVMVSGEVRKAGPVSVETSASLLSVLAAAGGWSEKADLAGIRLITPGNSEAQIIDLSAILRGDAVNPLVPPGAIVEIREK